MYNALTRPFLDISKKGRKIFDVLADSGVPFLLSGSGATIYVLLEQDLRMSACMNSIRTRLKTLGVKFKRVRSC
jgi:4-diphosphocytidyl-2C-methyl-D-erythritol kinase